jgi:hypothetical protein
MLVCWVCWATSDNPEWFQQDFDYVLAFLWKITVKTVIILDLAIKA